MKRITEFFNPAAKAKRQCPTQDSDRDSNSSSILSSEPTSSHQQSVPLSSDLSTVSDLSEKGEPPVQPRIEFPKNQATGGGLSEGRRFSSQWYAKFEWIEYSIQKNGIFCHTCRNFGHLRREESRVWTEFGFRDWRKIGQKLKAHNDTDVHKEADKVRITLKNVQKVGRVDQLLDPCYRDKKLIGEHKQHLLTVLDIVLFCAENEIALRGDDESKESLNRGNFLELLSLLSKYDPTIQQRLEKLPRNAQMLSPEIQNDLLFSAQKVLLEEIRNQVQEAGYYAVLADEVKDISNKELLGVSLRFLHGGKVHERAIGFMELYDLSAASISEQLQGMLRSMNLEKEMCVGQGYDGASVMSGERGGVQALMKRAGYTNAQYVHCASHRLNLVLASVTEIDPAINLFFETMDLVYTFMTGTKRHSRYLEIQKMLYPKDPQLELTHSSTTRWSSRSLEVEKFLRRFDVILDTLASFQNDPAAETKLSAIGLLKAIQTKKFLVLLIFFGILYDYTDVVTKGLQKKQTNAETAISLVETLLEHAESFDTEKVVKYALEIATKYDITDIDTRPSGRAQKLSGKLDGALVTGSVGHNCVGTVEDFDLVLRQLLGHIRGELRARFGNAQCAVMKAAAVCNTSSESFMDSETLKQLGPLFGVLVKESEMEIFKNYIQRRLPTEDLGLSELLEQCDRDIFPSVHRVLQLLLTIPQTSVTVERLFSSVKRIKTRMRSLMSTERLTSLCLISFEKDLLRNTDRERILAHFNNCKNR